MSNGLDRSDGSLNYSVLSEEVFVVEQQLIETRPCDIHQW